VSVKSSFADDPEDTNPELVSGATGRFEEVEEVEEVQQSELRDGRRSAESSADDPFVSSPQRNTHDDAPGPSGAGQLPPRAPDSAAISQRFAQRLEGIRQSANAAPIADDIPLHYGAEVHPPPPPYRALPETLNHQIEAPDYWKVLEHARKQGQSLGSGVRGLSDPANDDFANMFGGLNLGSASLEAAVYEDLFGKDVWTSGFRVGAAGELFVGLRHYYVDKS
jgi:hypothetical protein